MMHYVYSLIDADTGELLYIGRSIKPKVRLQVFRSKTNRKVVFGPFKRYADFDAACRGELKSIELLNPPFNKHKVSNSGMLGHRHSTQTREAMKGDPNRRNTWSEERTAKMSAFRKTFKYTDESRARMSASQRARRT